MYICVLEPMVRHEAGEALGAIGDPKVIDLLKLYSKDECPEVSETCELALKRLEWIQSNKEDTENNSAYDSVGESFTLFFFFQNYTFNVDPTPAAINKDVTELGKNLIDTSKSLWERYRAMFALRNINSPESIKALAQGLYVIFSNKICCFRNVLRRQRFVPT